MSIVARDILACAMDLAKQPRMNEAHARAIISRAYYAAFHDCKIWHAALPAPGQLPLTYRSGGDHAELITRLDNPDTSATPPQRKASKLRSTRLRALRILRNAADYDLTDFLDDSSAHNAIGVAVSIIGTI